MVDVFGGSAIASLAAEYGVIARSRAKDITQLDPRRKGVAQPALAA